MTTAITSEFGLNLNNYSNDFLNSFLKKEDLPASLFDNNGAQKSTDYQRTKEEKSEDTTFFTKVKDFFSSYLKDLKNCFDDINSFLNKPETYEGDFKRHFNPKDKEITCIEQGNIGDCWYLSAIQSMSYTRLGREIIEDSIELGENSSTFSTPYQNYVITEDELEKAKRGSYYSSGDEDALILELGAEKFFTDFAKGDVEAKEYKEKAYLKPEEFEYRLEQGKNVLEGGVSYDAYRLLSNCHVDEENDYRKKAQALDDFENCDNIIGACASIGTVKNKNFLYDLNEMLGTGQVENVKGKKFEVFDKHEYAIKKVRGDKVTFVNPWDTDIEITISKKDALKLFDYITIAYSSED